MKPHLSLLSRPYVSIATRSVLVAQVLEIEHAEAPGSARHILTTCVPIR